ncbi:glycosyl hydrolase family 28-related protein [Flavobacterium sp. PL002]|uniref:glycosyl hydrolase family 28-related protein n=1 Tax=Flavobacterium sp. PL002 TaxID=1897058 RepID=UPI0017887EA3|nr:glycosyl hydrolase family 28-related protein [Flavobacterium sp. PL002]MBE0391717.1 Iota-carrageenase [Flavobacterium sp. PL002]
MKLQLKLFYVFFIALLSVKCSKEYENLSEIQNSEIKEKPLEFEENTSRFYKKPKTSVLANKKNLVTDFGANNTDTNDDSDKLNEAILSLSNASGGKLLMPKGKYYLSNIKMLSNVHIEIEEGTEIYPTIGLSPNKNHRIFDFAGLTEGKIENASIVGKGGNFIVNLRNNSSQNLIVVDLGNVTNFELANFTIKDEKTIFASILVSFTNKPGDAWPHNGIIQNINQIDAHTGYGLIQAYAADNILFKNLKCTGGVTLRLETDNLAMKTANKGGVRDIFATKVTNINGLTPVMFSPHFMENGKVTINDVTAIGCAYAVRVEHGFIEIFDKENRANGQDFKNYIEGILGNGSVSELYKRNNGRTWAVRIDNDFSELAYNSSNPAVNGIKPGKFENSTVTDVKVIYKNTGAKLKHLFLPYLPCSEQAKVCKPGASGFEYNGPSLGVSIDNTKRDNSLGNYNVNVTTSRVQGFPSDYILNVKYNTPKLCNPNLSSIPRCN